MRAAMLQDYCGAKDGFDKTKITVEQTEIPEPEDGEVQIKVMASSVNPIDWKICSGAMRMMMPMTFPAAMGFDCTGVVSKVGTGVETLKVGDEVWADVIQAGRKVKLGAFAEYVSVPVTKVSLKPTNLDWENAAVVPLVSLTSLQALRSLDTKEGSKVLVLGGSGGTGIAAIQIAKAMGAYVYTTCSTRNVEFVKSLGPDEVIDYTQQKWGEVLKDKNIDGVFDATGEQDGLTNAIGALKENGKFTTIAAGIPKEPLPKGITGTFLLTNNQSVPDLDFLKDLCEAGKLSIKIDTSFPLEQVGDAFAMSMGGKVVGKVSIKVAQ